MRQLIIIMVAVLLLALPSGGERIKDIVEIEGVRGNPLMGYGLVIGLDGTGDGSRINQQTLTNLLRRRGIVLTPNDITSTNIASVIVTAELGPFSRRGSNLDVTVSTIDSTTSLFGGILLMTPLAGADGQVYAVAQGAISIGGYGAAGQNARVKKNHLTVGRVPNGATVEIEEIASFVHDGRITLHLRNPDFATADRISTQINSSFPDASRAVDAGTIRVTVPKKIKRQDIARFVESILARKVKVDQPALVVINERTGTIVIGQNVGISTVAITHGNLSIITQEKEHASQPLPFSRTGTTVITNDTEIKIGEQNRKLQVLPSQVSVSELARALNAMGLTPRDIIVIFQMFKEAGALQAKLKII